MKKIKINRILLASIFMTAIGGLQALYDHVTLHSISSLGPSALYDFESNFWLGIGSGGISGMIAAITLNYVDDKFRMKPYYQGLLIIILVFLSIWITRNIIDGLLLMQNGKGFQFLVDASDFRNLSFWMLIVMLTYFFFQMGNKFGPGKIFKIFLGRYNLPQREERVFMFLDLKSSTAIAEQLGELKYHHFLKEVFADLTNPILDHRGEIYQYVGDEIVLSWDLGKSGNRAKYLDCFCAIQELVDQQESKYLKKYGFKPQFKAGAHCGNVIAGEVGVIRRDITYSGDVLNTAARIQSLCNELKSSLLVSKDLFTMNHSDHSAIRFEQKGEMVLKGKLMPMELFGVSMGESK